jgi:DNA-directed RNA polymerase specialized sigma54-like protein|tara:strand:- start:167 stop:340 length:174 start_codon:yes stop_codon:yes gene_type:complete
METETTELIKNTLGASHSVKEVKAWLKDIQKASKAQAPYFDGRLLDQIKKLKTALGK